MPEIIKTTTEPIPPVAVTVIGTSEAGSPLTTGTVATTPDHQPNIAIRVVTPLMAIVVRFANAYLTMLVGLIGVGMTSNAIPAPDFLHLVLKCAGLSIAGAGFGLLKDLVTVCGKLEGKYPLMTGSV
jgi:hypothetical protein